MHFSYVLEDLRPIAAIILGKEMSKANPEAGIWPTDDLQVYRTDDGDACVCSVIDHPAAFGMPLGWKRLADLVRFAETGELSSAGDARGC